MRSLFDVFMALVAAWPILLYYHDRFLISVIPSSWTVDLIRRAQAYADFYSDPNRPR
jgi:hypothetical protein